MGGPEDPPPEDDDDTPDPPEAPDEPADTDPLELLPDWPDDEDTPASSSGFCVPHWHPAKVPNRNHAPIRVLDMPAKLPHAVRGNHAQVPPRDVREWRTGGHMLPRRVW